MDDFQGTFSGVPRFTQFNEIGVLGKTAGVDEEGDLELPVGGSHGADIFQRHRLPAAGVVGNGNSAKRNVLHSGFLDESAQLGDVQVALEGMLESGIESGVCYQVSRSPAARPDVGIRGVEVHVGGHGHAGFDQQGAKDIFGGATLVGGYEIFESKDFLHGVGQSIIGPRSSIGFVALHDGGPLCLAHRPGARISQQVHENFFRTQRKKVVTGPQHRRLSFFW